MRRYPLPGRQMRRPTAGRGFAAASGPPSRPLRHHELRPPKVKVALPAIIDRGHPAMRAAALAYRNAFGAAPVFHDCFNRRSKSAANAISWIAHDLTANELIRIVALIVAVSPDWKTIRRRTLPVRPGAIPARPGAQPLMSVKLIAIMGRLGWKGQKYCRQGRYSSRIQQKPHGILPLKCLANDTQSRA